MALPLDRYLESQGNALRRFETWERYAGLFRGDPRGYANAVDRINAAGPEDCERMAGILGGVLAEKEDRRNDILLSRRAIALDSRCGNSYRNLGQALIDSKKPEEAWKYLERAAELGSEAVRGALHDRKSRRGLR